MLAMLVATEGEGGRRCNILAILSQGFAFLDFNCVFTNKTGGLRRSHTYICILESEMHHRGGGGAFYGLLGIKKIFFCLFVFFFFFFACCAFSPPFLLFPAFTILPLTRPPLVVGSGAFTSQKKKNSPQGRKRGLLWLIGNKHFFCFFCFFCLQHLFASVSSLFGLY